MHNSNLISKIVKSVNAQMQQVHAWHNTVAEIEESDFYSFVTIQNMKNFLLWHEEDKARDKNASDKTIAEVKRNIDKYNQQRNDYIEKIDEYILSAICLEVPDLNKSTTLENIPINSETAGSMIDRCSIMALKIYHMNEEATRIGASPEHHKKCANKTAILTEQRNDLIDCLGCLINDFLNSKRRFKSYKQFKMYNDPTLNPVMYGSRELKESEAI